MVEKKILKKEIETINKMLEEGYSITAIAKTLNCSRMTIYRHLKEKQGFFTKLKNIFR